MTAQKDIRWEQRFANFKKANAQLHRFLQKTELNEMEQQGLIKAFEYTYELSWKTLQDLLNEKGITNVIGPKPVINEAFRTGYINDGHAWVDMHKSRNLTSHTYEKITAQEVIDLIRVSFADLFDALEKALEKEKSGKQGDLFDDQN